MECEPLQRLKALQCEMGSRLKRLTFRESISPSIMISIMTQQQLSNKAATQGGITQ